ncbi:hypothetical protein ACA910_009051 [Epithemia clementina (nom. ined.)]
MIVLFASEHDRSQEILEFSLLHNTVSTPEDMEADITFTMDISTIKTNSVADLEAWANSTALDANIDALVPFFNNLNTFDTMDTDDELLLDVVPPMDIVTEAITFITNPDPDHYSHEDPNASVSDDGFTNNKPDLTLPLLVGQLCVHDEDDQPILLNMYLEDNDKIVPVDLLCSVDGYNLDANISNFNSVATGHAIHFYNSDDDTSPSAPQMFQSPTLVIVETVPDESPSAQLLPDPIVMFPDHVTHSSSPSPSSQSHLPHSSKSPFTAPTTPPVAAPSTNPCANPLPAPAPTTSPSPSPSLFLDEPYKGPTYTPNEADNLLVENFDHLLHLVTATLKEDGTPLCHSISDAIPHQQALLR